MKKTPRNVIEYNCYTCNFICSKKSEYERHTLTAKHQRLKNPNKKTPQLFACECGKTYKHQSTLCAHKKKCDNRRFFLIPPNKKTPYQQCYENSDYEEDNTTASENDGHNTDVFVSLLKQNNEFKEMMLDQCTAMQQQTHNIQMQLIDALKESKTVNHITTNNNQKFNLNFFLNNTCKDAMNMSEFIENMNVEFKDIENIGKNGYVSGMTDLILSRIKDLDITKRPLHCTDLKRETMYIKDNNEWSKDTPENNKLRDMITIVAKHNYNRLPLWRERYPECNDWNNPKYSFCVDMMKNILGDVGDEQIKLDNKVIKNLSRHILVEKE